MLKRNRTRRATTGVAAWNNSRPASERPSAETFFEQMQTGDDTQTDVLLVLPEMFAE